MDVKYEPGTIKVVAYDGDGKRAAEESIHTAGRPYALHLQADRIRMNADGKDISFVTISVVDKQGNLCPTAAEQLNFSVKGQGTFRAACNGDATSLEPFHLPTMKTFSGKLVVLVQATDHPGAIELTVRSRQLKTGKLVLESVN